MQLSFVFLTALVAAVSATPLPQAAPPAADRFLESVPVGGNAGTPFSDFGKLNKLTEIPTITRFGGMAAVAIHQIYLTAKADSPLGDGYSTLYGGTDGILEDGLRLGTDEFLDYMEIETDDWVTGDPAVPSVKLVHFIKVGTNKGNWGTLGTSKPGRQLTPYYPPPGHTQIVGFNGRGTTVIDQLGPIWA